LSPTLNANSDVQKAGRLVLLMGWSQVTDGQAYNLAGKISNK